MISHIKEQPSAKLSLNCIECRKRKVRCDRGHPCSNCSIRGTICRNEVLRKPNRRRFHGISPGSQGQRQPSRTFTSADVSVSEATEVNEASLSQTNGSMLDLIDQDSAYASIYPKQHPSKDTRVSQTLITPQESDRTSSGKLDLNDILFSNELLTQLFGDFDENTSMDIVNDSIIDSSSNCLNPAPLNGPPIQANLCISRFNRDAANLSVRTLQEYRDFLPSTHEMDAIMSTLKKTPLSSTRSSLKTILDVDSFAVMLYQHSQKLLELSASSTGLLPASEVFYIACALLYASSLDKSSSAAKDRHLPLVIKLNKHLTGIDPSLMLMQACRLWSMACMQCNLVEEAASAIIIGGRAAVSIGVHKHDIVMKQPAYQRPLFTDALINLVCDGCVMRAVFALETPISLVSLDPSLFTMTYDEQDGPIIDDDASTKAQKPMPLILRLHACTWVFIGRYYHRQGRLRVPTELDLTPPPPVDEAEEYEFSQLGAISTILHHCGLELERPLSSWLSAVSFQQPSRKHSNESSDNHTAQSIRALYMLYLIRYYRILINYPFIHIQQESRDAVIEAARSTINTTWRLARQGATRFQDNLALYGHICLRAISFLASCRLQNKGSLSIWDKNRNGPDKDEQILADLELGVDALDKLDKVLNAPVSLASIASDHLSKSSIR